MMRFLYLYYKYLVFKIMNFGKIQINGFTIYFAFNNSNIKIGHGTIINSGNLSNLLGLYQRTIIVARNGGEIIIGKNAGISGSTIYSMSKINIGDNCLIGANCKIIDNDFHPLDFHKREKNDFIDIIKKPIHIGDNCFIGMNSIVLRGSFLGDNCVVGAGSVVSGKFPDNVIIAGNPAKIIKYLDY